MPVEEVEVYRATVAFALQQAEGGTNVAEVCRKMVISETTFCRWKLYGGLMPPEVNKLRQLEEDNARLRKVVDDLTFDKEMLQERGSGPPHHDIHAMISTRTAADEDWQSRVRRNSAWSAP
jgi:putative transposase